MERVRTHSLPGKPKPGPEAVLPLSQGSPTVSSRMPKERRLSQAAWGCSTLVAAAGRGVVVGRGGARAAVDRRGGTCIGVAPRRAAVGAAGVVVASGGAVLLTAVRPEVGARGAGAVTSSTLPSGSGIAMPAISGSSRIIRHASHRGRTFTLGVGFSSFTQ